jgi:hypothetical protein
MHCKGPAAKDCAYPAAGKFPAVLRDTLWCLF